MKFVVLSLVCLASSCQAVSVKEHSKASTAISLLLNGGGPSKVDTKTLVASLTETANALKSEDKKAFALAQESKSSCKKTAADLKAALNKGKRSFDMATADYQKTDAQVTSLQASLSELKGQVATSNTELDDLQTKLKKMRTDKGLLKSGASSALRQVEAVIAKTFLRESNEHHRGASTMKRQVSKLEELSESLSFLQETLVEEDKAEKKEPKAPVLILKADKQEIMQASEVTQRGFNEEEKKILDLVEVERKKLQDFEDNLADLQPAISNKLKQAMEINRTLDASKRGMDRDTALMEVEKKKCTLVQDSLKAQKTKRTGVVNDVLMASKVLEHMDTALFLSRDLQGLRKAAPTFLQEVESEHSFHEASRSALAPEPLSLLQEVTGNDMEELIESSVTSSNAAADGPFDKVTKMIGGLITSLKAQANSEVNKHQFCQDGLSENRRNRIAKQNSIDTLSSTVRWSKMAIVRLDDDLKFITAEKARLAGVQSGETAKLTAEETRVNAELAEHTLADKVITKGVEILTTLCSLPAMVQEDSEVALIQKSSSRVGSRFSQCKEAADLLKSASVQVKELDTATSGYLTKYTALSGTISSDAKTAEAARDTELKSTNSARAQRASELATANKDSKEGGRELVLIDTAKKELEHSCSHTETREEKMARRADEISALKEALNVLSGEAIPA